MNFATLLEAGVLIEISIFVVGVETVKPSDSHDSTSFLTRADHLLLRPELHTHLVWRWMDDLLLAVEQHITAVAARWLLRLVDNGCIDDLLRGVLEHVADILRVYYILQASRPVDLDGLLAGLGVGHRVKLVGDESFVGSSLVLEQDLGGLRVRVV